jgi:hypothetical protein
MSLTTCSACVLAASAGGAVGGYLAAGRRGRCRSRRAVRGSRTMRAWPGGQRADARQVRRIGPRPRGARSAPESRDDDGAG